MSDLTTIAFDADDTLWGHTFHFNLTEEKFVNLLAEYSRSPDLRQHLHDLEIRNLAYYGFGVKGFMLSMIETAIEVTQQRVPITIIDQILQLGRSLQDHPIILYPNVRDVIRTLGRKWRLHLITKGDLLDQERKIAQSGLGDEFDHVEIVSDKTQEVYETIFHKWADGPHRAMMVGNSARSDIIPALDAGCLAVHIPCDDDWAYEQCVLPTGNDRCFSIKTIAELPPLIDSLASRSFTDDERGP